MAKWSLGANAIIMRAGRVSAGVEQWRRRSGHSCCHWIIDEGRVRRHSSVRSGSQALAPAGGSDRQCVLFAGRRHGVVLCFGPQVRDKASSLRPLLCAQGPSRCGHPAAFFSASGLARVVVCVCVCVWLSVSAIRPALFCSAESAESAQLCSAWLSMALQFCTPIVCTTTGYSNIPWLMLDHSGPLLPVPTSYLGTMDMYVYRVVVSAAQCTSLAPLHVRTHARTNVQTSLAPVSCPAGHESRVQTSRWREACRSPVSQLRCMCCAVAVRVLLSILSVPTSGLPVPCLPVCLPACPPGRLARARHKNHHLPPSRHIV